jgi:hypothetical protein
VHGELEREKESWALFGGYRDALNKMANELWVTIRERCGLACNEGGLADANCPTVAAWTSSRTLSTRGPRR